jgi:hypothetical protein
MPAILSEPRSHFLSENKWNKADKYKKEQVITKWYASERKVISSGGLTHQSTAAGLTCRPLPSASLGLNSVSAA